jgi:hypothetical protein
VLKVFSEEMIHFVLKGMANDEEDRYTWEEFEELEILTQQIN